MCLRKDPWEFEWPISIDVSNGRVSAIWYTTADGIDGVLTEGEHYHVSYYIRPKKRGRPPKWKQTEDGWLIPKVYHPKKVK